MSAKPILYGYFRSSAAYRVRAGLNLKNIAYEHRTIHLVKDGGEQHSADYKAINPQELVPTLNIDGHNLSQSLAILEYLDETRSQNKLLPDDIILRSKVRSIAQSIACEIHPVANLRILQYLSGELNVSDDQKTSYYKHFVELGLKHTEALIVTLGTKSDFVCGDTPGLADLCIVPQMYNARRFNCDLTDCPRLIAIDAACLSLDAFDNARPENQPDAPNIQN